MKSLLLFSALLLSPAAACVAQAPAALAVPATPQHHHGNPHKAALRMGQQLGLSADQQARLEPILMERRQKADGIRANTQLSDAERHQQLKAVHRDSLAEMSKVLSPSQMQQMKAMRHARHSAATPPAGV